MNSQSITCIAALAIVLPICSYSNDTDNSMTVTTVPNQQVQSAAVCPWDLADIHERVALWQDMSPRHRDYHWRLMSPDERKTFRSLLSTQAQIELRNRFASRHPDAYVVKADSQHVAKHLSKEEKSALRQQIQQARQAQAVQIDQYKTPAQIEHEQQLRMKIAQLHEQVHSQILVVSLQRQQEKRQVQKESAAANSTTATQGNLTEVSTSDQNQQH